MADGSHATFGAYDPRVCCICDKPVRITGPEALTFYHGEGRDLAWHRSCEQPGWLHLDRLAAAPAALTNQGEQR